MNVVPRLDCHTTSAVIHIREGRGEGEIWELLEMQ